MGEQYTNTTRLDIQISVDWNEFEDGFIIPKQEDAMLRRHVASSAWYDQAYKNHDVWQPGTWECWARKDFSLLPSDTRIVAEISVLPREGGAAGKGLYVLDGDKQFAFAVPADGLTHQGLVLPTASADGKFYVMVVGGPVYIPRMACVLAG